MRGCCEAAATGAINCAEQNLSGTCDTPGTAQSVRPSVEKNTRPRESRMARLCQSGTCESFMVSAHGDALTALGEAISMSVAGYLAVPVCWQSRHCQLTSQTFICKSGKALCMMRRSSGARRSGSSLAVRCRPTRRGGAWVKQTSHAFCLYFPH
jgi:hypothetical protein